MKCMKFLLGFIILGLSCGSTSLLARVSEGELSDLDIAILTGNEAQFFNSIKKVGKSLTAKEEPEILTYLLKGAVLMGIKCNEKIILKLGMRRSSFLFPINNRQWGAVIDCYPYVNRILSMTNQKHLLSFANKLRDHGITKFNVLKTQMSPTSNPSQTDKEFTRNAQMAALQNKLLGKLFETSYTRVSAYCSKGTASACKLQQNYELFLDEIEHRAKALLMAIRTKNLSKEAQSVLMAQSSYVFSPYLFRN